MDYIYWYKSLSPKRSKDYNFFFFGATAQIWIIVHLHETFR
jgi:hypothetical protein